MTKKIKCEVKEIRKKFSYADADFEIDRNPDPKKETWESIGKAGEIIKDLSTYTGVEILPKDVMLNPEGVTRILKIAYPEAQGWRIIPIEKTKEREVVIECKEVEDES